MDDTPNIPVPLVPLPSHGALLGLDFGTKRMGVAVSNSDQTVAVPVETWVVREPAQNVKHLRELIEEYWDFRFERMARKEQRRLWFVSLVPWSHRRPVCRWFMLMNGIHRQKPNC